jgi:hypothetical protein
MTYQVSDTDLKTKDIRRMAIAPGSAVLPVRDVDRRHHDQPGGGLEQVTPVGARQQGAPVSERRRPGSGDLEHVMPLTETAQSRSSKVRRQS